MPCTIGLDLGTTTVTGVLWDVERGNVRRLVQRRNDAALAPLSPTRAEQDPHRLRTLSLEVLAELVAGGEGTGVLGIGLTGQMHGLLGVDGENRPLTPLISWQDRRTAEPDERGITSLERLHARLGDLPWCENGCRIAHGYGAATWYWLSEYQQLPAGTVRLCSLTGWLAGQLTGQPAASDPTLAASWGLYDLVQGAWNDGCVQRLALDARLLPPVRPAGERLGGLAPGVACQVGLPPGTPVHNGLGDNQAAFLGAGLPFVEPDLPPGASGNLDGLGTILFLNMGTGGQICWLAPRFEPPTETVETRPLLQGLYLQVGASLCGGAAYAWLMSTVRSWLAEFGQDLDEETVYQRLNALAAAAEGTAGLRVRTTFLGVRGDPGVQAGGIGGITLDNLRLGPLARATLIGMVDELRELYHEHAGGAGQRHSRIVAAGGGVYKNSLLPEVIAGRFGGPVASPPWREVAAVGAAALVAGVY